MNFALATLLVVQVAAQSGLGTVTGQVSDRDGGVIPGVTVTLTSASFSPRTAVTNASGRYSLSGVSAGGYELSFALAGFKPSSGRIQVSASQSVTANARLNLGDLTETMMVRVSQRAAQTPTAPSAAPTVVRVGGDIRIPRQIRRVEPAYPDAAVSAGIEGTVVIDAIIGKNGEVRDARIVKSVPTLDDAALAAVREWVYTPTLLNGVPVDVAMTVSISFAR